MITVDNFLHASGIVLIILISASIVSYTSKFILRGDRLKKPTDLIYDPDHGANITAVCIFSNKIYSTAYRESPCHNKTLIQWYNPWLRHGFWMGIWNEIKARNRQREAMSSKVMIVNATEAPDIVNDPVTEATKKESQEVQKPKEKRVEFVYSLLVGLLIISMVFACWEVFKDRLKKNVGEAAKSQEPECTLADFTINRHRRRESQQQQQTATHLPRQASFETTAKVTQTLIHQSSLDRAFPKTISEVKRSMEERRNSVPCLKTDLQISGRNSLTAVKLIKRQSVDVTEDICLDLRKKSRHLIRRH